MGKSAVKIPGRPDALVVKQVISCIGLPVDAIQQRLANAHRVEQDAMRVFAGPEFMVIQSCGHMLRETGANQEYAVAYLDLFGEWYGV
jgi:hypothetical protein